MARKKRRRYSGIGGQAVLEGVMMKNKEKYAVAVRRPDGGISVETDNYQGILGDSWIGKMPFVRGVVNFIDSMILGTRCLNQSVSLYDDNGEGESREGAGEKAAVTLTTCTAVVLAVGIFVVLPYYLASLFTVNLRNQSLVALIEGAIRIAIFLLYVIAISAMRDIRRLYRYHGAEHKCINCIERGRPLTVENAMRSSRLHRRCGTSFIFFVFFISIILFFFIRVENSVERVATRILLMPVVAGISYEFIRLAGRSDFFLWKILSLPGMAVQLLTTKAPDRKMVEVAIAAVEAVFDWEKYLSENFGYRSKDADVEEPEEETVEAEGYFEEEAPLEEGGSFVEAEESEAAYFEDEPEGFGGNRREEE